MLIRVPSFDFDGCLFHLDYIHREKGGVIEANEAFLNQIKDENSGFDSVVVFVGSNRQSWDIDLANFMGRGSCFPAVRDISAHLGATLDPFLLADIYGDLADGDSYRKAISVRYTDSIKYFLHSSS